MTADTAQDVSALQQDVAVIKNDLEYIKASLARIEQMLFGDGSKPSFGTRLEFVERSVSNFTKFMVGLAGVFVVELGAFVWGVLTHTITIVGKVP